MPKSATASNVKHPQDHAKKGCVCGGHSNKARHAKPKGKRPVRAGRPNHVPVLG